VEFSNGQEQWVPPGRARGTHFVSLRLRCAPLRATPRRLPFARDTIPSKGPRPEAVARVEGPEQPKPGTDRSAMFLTAEAISHSRSSSEIKGFLHVNLFLLVADGIPFSVNDEKNRPTLFPRRVTEDFSPVLEIHGAGTGSRPGVQRAATTPSARFLITGDKDFNDPGVGHGSLELDGFLPKGLPVCPSRFERSQIVDGHRKIKLPRKIGKSRGHTENLAFPVQNRRAAAPG